MTVAAVTIRQSRGDDLDVGVIGRLYEVAFPAWQRDDLATMLASSAKPGELLLVASSEQGVAGFSRSVALREVDVEYLEYLVVEPGQRSRGIGGALLGALRERAAAAGQTGLIYEVEPLTDDLAVGAAEREERVRRIAFYQRNGAVVITAVGAYREPRLDGPGTEPMTLMWLPVTAAAPPPHREQLLAVLRAMFIQGYAAAPADAESMARASLTPRPA